MSLTQVTLATLPDLEDGKIAVAFDRLLQAAADDCDKRPGDPKPRVVTIKVAVTPAPYPDGTCDKTTTEVEITGKNPPMRSQPISMRLHKGGRLSVNLDSPDDVNQTTMLPRDRE